MSEATVQNVPSTQQLVNRSQLIRDALKGNPSRKPKEVIEFIKTHHGIEVSSTLVNQVKFHAKRNNDRDNATVKATRTHGGKPGIATSVTRMVPLDAVEELLEVRAKLGHANFLELTQKLGIN